MTPWVYGGSTHGYSLNLAEDADRNFIHFIANYGVDLTTDAKDWFDLGLIEYDLTFGYSYVFVAIPKHEDRILFKLRWY